MLPLRKKLGAFRAACGLTRGDLLLTGGLLLLCGLAALTPVFLAPQPRQVVVKVDGTETARLPFDRDTVYDIGTGNVIEIKNGGVRMLSADCPDRICVRTGRITRAGQTIVCLPHRVTVTVTGGRNDGCDAQTY